MSRLERLYSPPEIGAPGKREAGARRRVLFFSGLFVIAMTCVVAAVLVVVLPGLRSYRLVAYFPDAAGLDGGIQVIQDGYVVGLVESVTPVFPGSDSDASQCPPVSPGTARAPARPCFRAVLRIRKGWPVPVDSRVRLGSAGLLAGSAILLQPGVAADHLRAGAVIDAAGREADLMARLTRLTDSLDRIVEETVAPALASIRAQIKTIETLIGAGEDQGGNRERLAGAFESLRKLAADLEAAVDPEKIAAILGSVQAMSARLEEVAAQLPVTGGEVRGAVRQYGELAGEIKGLVKDNKPALQRSLDDTQYLLQQISASLVPILTNIEDATRNLSALSRDLRNDPAVIIKGREVEEKTPWFK